METGILYILDIIRYYLGIKILFKKRISRLWIPVMGEAICLLVIFACRDNDKIMAVISVGVYFLSFVSIIIMVEGEIKERLLYTLGLFAIFACLDELVGFFLAKVSLGVIYKFIFECLGSIVFLLILLSIQKMKIQMKRTWLTFFVILASVCVAVIIFVFSNTELVRKLLGQTSYKIMLLAGYGCLVGLILVTFYTREISQKEQELLEMETHINKMQKQYYLSLLEKETDTRKYRHDINNHLMCLRELVDGNLEAQNYIDSLQEQLCTIKGRTYETGSEILNILLSNHLSRLTKEASVSVVGKLTVQPDINDVDFCTIFSNLLSNAVEEVERLECSDSYIRVEIKVGKMYVMITIKNSSVTIIDNEGKGIMTKKQDKKNHGIGLGNVCDAINRNDGEFSLEGNGEEVSAKVILNIKSNR